MNTKKWAKPMLCVLAKDKTQQSVLQVCKAFNSGAIYMTGVFSGCARDLNNDGTKCSECYQADCTFIEYDPPGPVTKAGALVCACRQIMDS